ncbi:MAG: ferritin-like domain-containing protein [Desulfurococcales archaeon]|nr:ferritin-like domain-containing protein [Desulfurococcales archaeon]
MDEKLKKLYEIASKGVEEEKKYAERLRSLANRIKHPVLQALFKAIAHDSEKHSFILEAIKKYLEQERPLLSKEELEEIKKEISEHIREEAEAIRELNELRSEVDLPQLKLLIEAMLNDERIHHELLVSIQRIIAEKETVEEDDFWDYIWKHSPWHGTPGG